MATIQLETQSDVEPPTVHRWEKGLHETENRGQLIAVAEAPDVTNGQAQCQTTVKQLLLQDCELCCVPRSDGPAQRPYKLDEPEPGFVQTSIAAVVVTSVPHK